MSEKDQPIEFEQAFAELEALVSRMETGEQSLQKSVDDFQAGIGLIKTLQKNLEDAEQKVDILLKDANGELSSQSFTQESE
ncbi:MAG: exodeoxyribonuclease VII small subunit [Arenicella sp.]